MSSLALMRWLEATPGRYDAGMRVVTLGRVTALHDAVARAAVPRGGVRVLEVGCGTGTVTGLMVSRGAHVTAIDQSAEMLEQARARLGEPAASGRPTGSAPVDWIECTASEIDALPKAEFDAVVFSLCLSEMSADERRFVLSAARERLGPGGRVIVADEVYAHGWRRAVQKLVRAPQWILGWLLAGAVSGPLADIALEIEHAGLSVASERRWLAGTLALFVAEPAP